MSSRVVLECTFSTDKKKRDKKKVKQNLPLKQIGNKAKLIEANAPRNNNSNFNEESKSKETCEYEMKIIFIPSEECKNDDKMNETQNLK